MKYFSKLFKIKYNKLIPVDEFIEKILYKPKIGYYQKKNPFGSRGDFITAPTISNLFSEIIGIWIISTWEKFGKPKKFNFVELGPGDGSLSKILIDTFKRFPTFEISLEIYLYEKSELLKNIQKKKLSYPKLKKDQLYFLGMNFLMQYRLNNLKIKKTHYLKNVLLLIIKVN